MRPHFLWLSFLTAVLYGCISDYKWTYLDPAIPRIETPSEQIAYIGTTWVNGNHRQTTLYNRRGRVLETFAFGISSAKTLNRYEGDKNPLTIHYSHSDSSPVGEIGIDTVRRTFDEAGRMVADVKTFGYRPATGRQTTGGFVKRSFAYNAVGDTIVTQLLYSNSVSNRLARQQTNIDRWEHDRPGRATRHYRLYVLDRKPGERPDTIYHWSQRFAYDASGRRTLAWFDLMYLGQSYLPVGPDTIRYAYDQQGRVVREAHRYTTDKRNKREINPLGLTKYEQEAVARDKYQFYVGDEYGPRNNRTDVIEHRYESFNPKKHLPLHVPTDIGY